MSCTIIDKSFVDDLQNYELIETSNELSIKFNNGISSSVDISKFKKLIDLQPNYTTEFWQPIFINVNNSDIQTKKVNRNFTAIVEKLGIENFLNFSPQFQNWSTLRYKMSLDWLLTDDNFVFKPIFGLLGWIRSPKIYSLLESPINTVFTVHTGFTASSITGDTFDFTIGHKIVKYNTDICINLNATKDSNKFFAINEIKNSNIDVGYTSPIPEHNVQLYISDGDFFSYFLNSSLQSQSYDSDNPKPSLSYISPTLWKDYQHIYNVITKSLAIELTESQYLWVNKLCGILSTHPIRDRITQELFSSTNIREAILNIINTEPFSVDSEIAAINNINNVIFTLKDFSNILNDYTYNNYSDGFINTKSDLFSKLMYKYSPYVLINQNATIEYSKSLDSPHIYLNQILTCHCKKDLENTVISNDISFELSGSNGQYALRTNFVGDTSEYDIITKSTDKETKYNIPLYDVAKNFPIYNIDKPISFSAGPDIYIPITANANACGEPAKLNGFDFAPTENRLTTTTAIQWTKYTIEKDTLETILQPQSFVPFYDIESIIYEWELISGPAEGIKLTNSDKLEVDLEFSTFGKFTLQLTATMDTLSFIDTIDIYIVNKTGCNVGIDSEGMPAFKEEVPIIDPVTEERTGIEIQDNAIAYVAPDDYLPGNKSSVAFNRNRSGKLDNYLDYRNNDAIIIPNDRNICKVPNILELLFSKYGAISVIKSNSYYNLQSRVILANDDGQRDAPGYVGRLDNTARFNKFFYEPIKSISTNNSKLIIRYFNNNTIMKLFSIRIEKLRDNSTGRCKSIYQNLLYQTTTPSISAENKGEPVTKYDRDIPGQSSTLLRYKFDSSTRTAIRDGEQELHPMPELSDFGVNIKPFGGRKNPFDIHIPDVPIENLMLPKTKKDTVKGHLIDQEPVLCHLREAEIYCNPNSDYDYPSHNPNIKFRKGTYHPGIGFVSDTQNKAYHNKTSSLKFSPGNKSTFVFKGPGFYGSLRGGSQQSSSISVNNGAVDFTREQRGSVSIEKLVDTKDLDDIDVHHGYRVMNGQIGRLAKDHLLYDEYAGSYGSYSMTMRGRRFSTTNRIQGSDLLFGRIRNLEVKLNFLNQINLKNTAIWITFQPCQYVTSQVSPTEEGENEADADPQGPSFKNDPFFPLTNLSSNNPIVSNIDFRYQSLKDGKKQRNPSSFIKHKNIAKYLTDLQQYNSTQPGSYNLYLLNREHVDSNSIDTILHFSDRFSKNLTARNTNTDSSININQSVNVNNYIKLQPTLCIPDFIDNNTDKYATAIKNNDIFLAVNNFIKFFNQPMFMGSVPETAPEGTIAKPNSSFIVTLNIEVFDDYDMVNMDTISNLAVKTDQNATNSKQIADSIFNSLCSWEIIVHTDADSFADTDNLGKIKYGWEPSIPGYNFISEDSSIQNKLPKTVIDAPNIRLNDFSPCYYDKNIDDQITPLRRPEDLRFPSEAVVLAISSLFVYGIGGLVGLSIGFALFLSALSAITRFLSSIKRQQTQEQLAAAFVKSVYTERGYGGPDKILLDVGVNEPFVYNLEASIYKYSNTPLLKRKVRKYIKTSLIPELSNFAVDDVNQMSDLVSPHVLDDTSELSLIDNMPNGLQINKNVTVKDDSLVLYDGQLYVTSTGTWSLLDNTNIPLSVLCENNLLALDISRLQNMSLINGNRAYNYFASGQYVTTDGIDRYDIVAKGKIVKNNNEYTVIEFANGRPNAGSNIYLPSGIDNNIIVWSDKENNTYNNNLISTDNINTMFPKGTYGAGTPLVESSILSNQLTYNNLPTIYNIFNNQECNIKPTNRITIYNSNAYYSDMIQYPRMEENFAYHLGVYDAPEVLQGLPEPLNHELTAGYSYNIFDIVNNPIINRPSSQFIEVKNETDDTSVTFSHLLHNLYNVSNHHLNVVELNNSNFNNIANSGYIVVEGDYELGYAIGLRSQSYGGDIPSSIDFLSDNNDADVRYGEAALNDIISRLRYLDSGGNSNAVLYSNMSIPQLKNIIPTLAEDDIECIANRRFACSQTQANEQLSALYHEKNKLLNLLDNIGIIYNNNYNIIYNPLQDNSVIPHKIIYIEYDEPTTPITIHEVNDIDRYWINIDPEQQCKTSRDSSIKILVEAKYTCFPTSAVVAGELGVIPTLDRDAQNICPSEASDGSSDSISFDTAGNVFTYTFSDKEINRQKQRYSTKYKIPMSAWSDEAVVFPGPTLAGGGGTATRSFFIRPGTNSTDILVEVTEKYLVLKQEYFATFIDSEEYGESFYEYTGKVKDIIPKRILDAKNIVCRSRVIPRKLKKLDTHYDKFKVDFHGNLVRTLPDRGPGGPFTNIMSLWHCISEQDKKYIDIPDYFKIKNEMIYRAYFGSTDNIEHVSDFEDSLDPFEWIPYEYHPPFADDEE